MGDRINVPCSSLDAEASVLSSMLCGDGEHLSIALELLKPEDFYADANRRIFEAIIAVDADGLPVDIVAVLGVLQASGRLDQIGGSPYLAELAHLTPAVANLQNHCRIVKTCARVRRATGLFNRLMAEGYDPSRVVDGEEWLQRCEQLVYQATADHEREQETSATLKQMAQRGIEQINEASQSKAETVGIPLGFRDIDGHLSGMREGELWFVAGRPGSGKTAFVVQALERAAEHKRAAIFFSLEMELADLTVRWYSRRAEINSKNLELGRLQPDQWRRLVDERQRMSEMPVLCDEDFDLTPFRLRSKVRRHMATLRREHGDDLRLGVIAIDYIQLMDVEDNGRPETRAGELGKISRTLKKMSKEFGCTVIALSQLKRPTDGQKVNKPRMFDLRESGALEADADVIIAFHREDQYRADHEPRDHLADVLILKARKSGEAAHILQFDGRYTAFYERDRTLFEKPQQQEPEYLPYAD